MTQIKLDTPVDERTFQSGLAEFLRSAVRNDVPMERAWECTVSDEESWEVEIVRVHPEAPPN